MKKTLLFAMGLLMLLSCQKQEETIVKCKMTNRTDESFNVKTYYKYTSNGVQETPVLPNQTKDIFYATTKGVLEDINIEEVLDSVVIKLADGRKLIKPYNQSGDWSKDVLGRKATISFYVEVDSNDFD